MENVEVPSSKPFDEERCLALILNPEFVEHLAVLKQNSGSMLGASTQSDVDHQDIRICSGSKTSTIEPQTQRPSLVNSSQTQEADHTEVIIGKKR